MTQNKKFKPNFSVIFKIYPLLSKKLKGQLNFAFILILVSAFAEIISLSSLIPFLLLITDPEKASNNNAVKFLISSLNLDSGISLLITVTIIFCLATILAGIIKSLNLFVNSRLSADIGTDLSTTAYKSVILQPYRIHLFRNSSEIISSLSLYIDQTVLAVNNFLQFSTSLIISIFLIIGLIIINWRVTLSIVFLISISYFLLSLVSNKRLRRNSEFISKAEKIQVQIIQESIGSIREVLLSYTHDIYFDKYKNFDFLRRRKIADTQIIAKYPRFLFEAIGIITLALISFILALSAKENLSVITLIGTFAFGAQRLLPSIQQIYFAWAKILGNSESVYKIIRICKTPIELKDFKKPIKKFKFDSIIKLENLCFEYNNFSVSTLKNINLEIKKGEIIGIKGKTGSGKSTLLDILMGLIEPNSGNMYINGIDIYSPLNKLKLNSWKFHNSHVAQFVFLKDSTILDNITFGTSKKINSKRLKEAINVSQLNDFINSLPDGIETLVGERGVRLSGGQKQRIGIARALYKKSEVLFLDEATISLDSETERDLIESLKSFSNNLTLIMVSHRESSFKYCDKIITIDSGKIKNIEKNV